MARTLYKAGWVVPISREPFPRGAILVDGGRIEAVGKWNDFESAAGLAQTIEDDQAWIFPGFINTHHHNNPSFALGYKDENGEIGLFRVFSRTGFEDPEKARAFQYLSTQAIACQLLRSGVTTTLDMAWGGASTGLDHRRAIEAYQDLKMRVVFAPIARDRCAYVYGEDDDFLATLPPDLAKRMAASHLGQSIKVSGQDYLSEWMDYHDRYDDGNLTRLILAFDGPVWATDAMIRTIADFARREELPVHLHNAESKLEIDWAKETYGKTSTAHLLEMGLLRPTTSFAHGIWVTDEDMRICAENGVSIAHTPSSEMRWYVGICPVVDWLRAGVNVSLGTDGYGFSDNNDFLEDMRLASLLQRAPALLDWPGVSSSQLLTMATINGAKSLGIERQTGTLEAGKSADFVVIDGNKLTGSPVNPKHDIREVLIQRARAEHVKQVIIAGNLVVDDGKVLTLDENRIVSSLRSMYEELWSRSDPERDQLIEDGLVYVKKYFSRWEANHLPARYRFNCQ